MLLEKICMLECAGEVLNPIGSQVGQCRNEELMLMIITFPACKGVFGRLCHPKTPFFFPPFPGEGEIEGGWE
jgi:hypothetical protein